jgi:hypothetical protein
LVKNRIENPERTKATMRRNNRVLNEQRKKDPTKHAVKLAMDKKYRSANKEKVRIGIALWSLRNPEKVKAYAKKTKAVNSGNINALTVKRRLAKLHRTPKWVGPEEQWLIKQAYQLAALRTKMFGFAWHVDHIIPLCGKIVSGLHVPQNLQVIPAAKNMSKLNKFEVA